MPPTAGKIHKLPIKVLYTLDSSSQTYYTILPEKQDVYVHPPLSNYSSSSSSTTTLNENSGGGKQRNGVNGNNAQAGPSRLGPRSRSNQSQVNGKAANGIVNGDNSQNGGHVNEEGRVSSEGKERIDWMGSCTLRSVAWGICFSSPECVPSPSYHDFSVYSLEPSNIRPKSSLSPENSNSDAPVISSSPAKRAFTPSSSANSDSKSADVAKSEDEGIWSGKGFLSWSLYENSPGKTLLRGKLIADPDFNVSSQDDLDDGDAEGGGLEGLVAAEERRQRLSPRSRDDENGEEEGIWGLEVCLSLKYVNLGGKAVGNKKEFGDLISKGKEVGAGSPLLNDQQSNNNMNKGNGSGIGNGGKPHSSTPINGQSAFGQKISMPTRNAPRRIEPVLLSQPQPQRSSSMSNGLRIDGAHGSMKQNNQNDNSMGLPRSTSSVTSPLPTVSQNQPRHMALPSRPGSTSNTVNRNDSINPSSSSSAGPSRSSSITPIPPSSSTLHPRSSTITNDNDRSSSIPPNPQSDKTQVASSINRNTNPTSRPSSTTRDNNVSRDIREITPPPRPQPKSPPPSTPSRNALRHLLNADGKFSPDTVRTLTNNPTLIRLLKSVPSHNLISGSGASQSHNSGNGVNGVGGSTLKSPFKTEHGDNGSTIGGHPPAFTNLSPLKQSMIQSKASPATSDIPTPASSITIIAQNTSNPSNPQSNLSQSQVSGNSSNGGIHMMETGCDNCQTYQTEIWRMKKMKDGKLWKVCNECGLYFNKYKKMRPEELWSSTLNKGINGSKDSAKSTGSVEIGQSRSGDSSLDENGRNNKRQKVDDPPIRSSPRNKKRTGGAVTGNVVPPSPRRNTRQAVKDINPFLDQNQSDNNPVTGSPTSKGSSSNSANTSITLINPLQPTQAHQEEKFVFSPSSFFNTSPILPSQSLNHNDAAFMHPHQNHHGHHSDPTGAAQGGAGGEMGSEELEALLAQFVQDGENGEFDIDKIFAEAGIDWNEINLQNGMENPQIGGMDVGGGVQNYGQN